MTRPRKGYAARVGYVIVQNDRLHGLGMLDSQRDGRWLQLEVTCFTTKQQDQTEKGFYQERDSFIPFIT